MRLKRNFKTEQNIEIARSCGSTYRIPAKLLKIAGFNEVFAVHESLTFIGYTVTEIETGHSVIAFAKTKAKAIADAKKRLDNNKKEWPKVFGKAKKTLKKLKINYPVNEIK